MPKRHKPHNWQLGVVAGDFHVPFHDERGLELFKAFLRHERPDWLILAGDFTDFWEISRFDRAPRAGVAFREEIKAGRMILASLRRILPKAKITWVEGNHEFRLRKYLIENAAALYGLPGLSVPELYGLGELEIGYVPCHASASRFTDNFVRIGKRLYVGHWDRVARHGGYAAKGLVEEKGVSLVQGHTHRFGAHARTTLDGRVLLGVENFCLCARTSSYIAHANWQLGFSAVYTKKGSERFQWYPVMIDKSGFVWNGKAFSTRAGGSKGKRKPRKT